MTLSRDFKGIWISKEIWLSTELSLQEKVMIVEIDSLTKNDKGYCYANNRHFAEFFGLSPTRISHIISDLQKRGILEIWDITKGKQVIERRMKIRYESNVFNSLNRPLADPQEGHCENSKDSNTERVIQKRKSFSKEKRKQSLREDGNNAVDQENPKQEDLEQKDLDQENPKQENPKQEDLEQENPKQKDLKQQIEEVLEHWYYSDGKVHQSLEAQGMIKIQNMIYELLIDGANPYIKLVSDQDLRFKKWTVEEIKSSIDYYVKVLNKKIDNIYFDQFIVLRYFGKKYKTTAPDHSPLVNCFLHIKDSVPTEISEKLKNKIGTVMNGVSVSSKVFIKASKYLEIIDEKYKVSDGACISLHKSMLNVFVRYVKEKKNDYTWKLEYIAGDTFRDEFLEIMLKRNTIEKKNKARSAYR